MFNTDIKKIEFHELPEVIKSTLNMGRVNNIHDIGFIEETEKVSQYKGKYLILLRSDFITPYAYQHFNMINEMKDCYVSIQRPTIPNNLGNHGIEIEILVSKEIN